jgi:peptidoglycan-associated lipoprotein
MTMIGRSRCHSRSRSQLLSLTLLVVILAGSTACSTVGPRKHWWEFWKPKASMVSGYHPDTEILPPPPGALDQNGGGQSSGLAPMPVAIPDATALRKGDLRAASELQTVYFEFDSSELSSAAMAALDGDAQWLQANATNEISIQGHCDERGSEEYNMNLGMRRAKVVRDYLASKGVDANKLHTISYGAMRPEDPGHGEAAYAKNRRVQFLIY